MSKYSGQIEKIVILGGGTSGWTTAMHLAKSLNLRRDKEVDICLVESPNLPTVGVGEATFPSLVQDLKFFGFDEYEWMRACKATFKLGVKFENWSGREDFPSYNTAFAPPTRNILGGEISVPEYQMAQRALANKNGEFYQAYRFQDHLIKQCRAPKLMQAKPYESAVNYAYHLDADLHGIFCQEKAREIGVRQVRDTVTEVQQDDNGYITNLVTEENGKIAGDLFIDCSGFRGFLINQVLDEPFEDVSETLLCDSAVVIKVPRTEFPGGINSFTRSTAVNNGWIWEIPLADAVSYGYVYSSAFATKEQAENELREFLGGAAGRSQQFRHLKMRTGKNKRTWVKNCVAVGLSDGFIEPLESTGLVLMHHAVKCLVDCFPDKSFSPALRDALNQMMSNTYKSVLDFIAVHYCVTNRDDTEFWKANRNDLKLPDSLQAILESWNAGRILTNPLTADRVNGFFEVFTYARCFFGLGYLPARIPERLHHIDLARYDGAIDQLDRGFDEKARKLPGHRQFLEALHKGKIEARESTQSAS